MSELIVVRGPGKGSTVALAPERSVTIGSGLDANVRVGGDGIAAEHVVVKALKGGGFGCKALAGSFVLNGKTVEAARLNDGDLLSIGDCEIRFAAERKTEPPAELAGFTLLGVLGRGGMGVVWRAEQKSLGREVALKVLSEELTKDPIFVGRFQAEARAAARLHHPNVVQVFDVDHVGTTWFYSMELMHAGSLETRIKREGKLPVADAVRAIRDAAKGLAFAEQMRLVHRDIKPDNLMIDRHGHVKLADLGLAQVEDDGDGKLRGTPHFMSPEQVQRKPLDHRSDLYSLGCTFYRLLTGRTPFVADNVKEILRAQVQETPVPANKVEPAVPQELAAIVDRLLQKDPAQRHQSAQELVEELEAALTPPAKKGLWIAIAAVALVVAAIAIVLALRDPPPSDPREVIKVVTDPNAQRALADAAEREAEIARLSVMAKQLDGEALAAALEQVAKAHAGTTAATAASEEAKRVRTTMAEAATRAEAQRVALAAATATLQRGVDAALEQDDIRGALDAAMQTVPDAAVAETPELAAAREALRARIAEAASRAIAARRAAIESAEAASDLPALDAALASLETALRGERAWPGAVLADATSLAAWLDERKLARQNLANSLGAVAEAKAIAATREALFQPDGLLSAVAKFQFALAAERLDALATLAEGTALRATLIQLRPSLAEAEAYCVALETGAPTGDLTPPLPPTALAGSGRTTVVGFTRGPNGASLATKTEVGGRSAAGATIDGDELALSALDWLPELDSATAPKRAALLGWLALAHQLRAARAYLALLDPANDASGSGEQVFVPHPALAWAAATLAGQAPESLTPLATELAAANLCARGLQAFATGRHATAIARLERLGAKHPQSLVVRSQR
jgi:hypothetical protein